MATDEVRRFKNFSDKDVNVLIALVKKYSHVVENKKSNAVTWKEKSEGWETIAKEYESLTGETRSTKNLKGKWENIKKDTKRKFSIEKQELYKTGGGPYVPTKTSEKDLEIKNILGVSVEGLENTLDSDNIEIVFEKGDEEVETSNTYREAPSSKLDYIGTKNEANEITIECEGETGGTKLTKTPKASPLWVQSNTNDIVLECGNNWTKILKTPKSSQLCGKPKPMLSRARRKADITNECKTRISALSEVRMELCQLQMQSLKEENERKQQEHKLNMKQKKEIHLLDVQHKQLQLDLLKKQIPSP